MPWYYAGSDATPVGPLSLEELRAQCVQGTVKPDTYIIEHTGQATDILTWRRYRDVFPDAPTFPPLPPPAPAIPLPHAAPAFPTYPPHPGTFPPAHRPDPYYQSFKPTNNWCAWGFGLGLTGFFFSFACGIGLLLALPSLLLCIVGLSQVSKNQAQSGRGLAVAGLVLSGIALVISMIFFASFALPMIRAHQLTVTEQTSNDSE